MNTQYHRALQLPTISWLRTIPWGRQCSQYITLLTIHDKTYAKLTKTHVKYKY